MTGEEVPEGAEEVVAEEGEARPVGQDEHPEAGVHVDDVRSLLDNMRKGSMDRK